MLYQGAGNYKGGRGATLKEIIADKPISMINRGQGEGWGKQN